MKINSRKKLNKKILLIVLPATLLLAVGGYTVYAKSQNIWPFVPSADETAQQEPSNDQSEPTNEGETNPDSSSDLPSKNNSEERTSTDGTTDLEQKPSEDPPKAIEMPRIERASQSGSQVKIVASFQKSSTGKCEAALQKNSTQVKRTSSIMLGPSYYTCSFTIPVSSLSSSGTWQLTVSHLRGSSVSTTDLLEVEIQR